MVTNVAPFKDLNPDTPEDQRYKAIARHRRDGLYSLASPDGRHWRRLQTDDEPLMTAAEGPFDSHNTAFHDPSRFVDARTPTPDWPRLGVSDGIFMSSRDGPNFERTFMEAFLRPGPDNWHERSVYIERGVLHTGPREMSMFAMEHLHLVCVPVRQCMTNVHWGRLPLTANGKSRSPPVPARLGDAHSRDLGSIRKWPARRVDNRGQIRLF